MTWVRYTLICWLALAAAASQAAAQVAPAAPPAAQDEQQETREERREERRERRREAQEEEQEEAGPSDQVRVEATTQEKVGDIFIYTGYVDAKYQNIRLQADRVQYNETTNDAVAEGNVVFDQGASQRVTARRAEINVASKLGIFYDATGFTDRTPTGEFLYYTATRIDKVGPDEYVLFDAEVTACEDSVPKWSFRSKKVRLRLNDRVRLRNAVFDIKGKPVFWLPYASIPINRRERQSGFLLPRFGNSNTKGFTYSQAYYQTLGRSADATIRGDYFSARGLGLGLEFRARTDERSGLRVGGYLVKDRIFGEEGPDQGGSAFFLEGVQYLPHGWLAVADVRVTSNLAFRRTFSDTFEEIINPQERSTLYFNNNYRQFSINLLAESDSTAIRQQNVDRPRVNADFSINVRHLPSVEVRSYDRPVRERWPIYFSFDAAAEGLRRTERVGDTAVFETPNVVQRLDLAPRFTFPLPLPLGGWAVTPSLVLRSTFYSNSLDPDAVRFNARSFTLDPNDPRIIVTPTSKRPVQLFDPVSLNPILGDNLSRAYAELAVDVRPPALGRVFTHEDGSPWFKHVVEPYLVYRRIAGVSNYERLIIFDERDAVANTNELEYGITNRFFVRRRERGTAGRTEGDEGGQPHELLALTVRQKYFFDPTFGGVLSPTERNQFYPINTFSGFGYGGIERRFSPINVQARVRPLSALFGDLRLDYDVQRNGVKDVSLTAGARGKNWTISETYFFARRFRAFKGRVEPGTYAGNQWITSVGIGNVEGGLYGGTRLNIDFTNRVDLTDPVDRLSTGGILNTRSYLGYAWDCCGVQFNVSTYDLPQAGRRETNFYFTFTLAGIGSIGNENIGQPAQTRRLGRGRGRRAQLDLPEDE
jgi:LPS-assembly protein